MLNSIATAGIILGIVIPAVGDYMNKLDMKPSHVTEVTREGSKTYITLDNGQEIRCDQDRNTCQVLF